MSQGDGCVFQVFCFGRAKLILLLPSAQPEREGGSSLPHYQLPTWSPRVPGTLPGPSELILCLSKGIATWAQFHWWSDTCLQLFLEKFVWGFVYTVSWICYSFANSEDNLGSSTQPNVSLAWVFSLAGTVTPFFKWICVWICWRWYLAEADGAAITHVVILSNHKPTRTGVLGRQQ